MICRRVLVFYSQKKSKTTMIYIFYTNITMLGDIYLRTLVFYSKNTNINYVVPDNCVSLFASDIKLHNGYSSLRSDLYIITD